MSSLRFFLFLILVMGGCYPIPVFSMQSLAANSWDISSTIIGGIKHDQQDHSAGVYSSINAPHVSDEISLAPRAIAFEQGTTMGSRTAESVRRSSGDVIAQLGEPSVSNVKLADLNGDGRNELIVTTLEFNPGMPGPQGGGRIHVLSSDGITFPGWPVTLAARPLNNSAAIGDIDGDGNHEIVVVTYGNSNPDGASPQKVWAFTSVGVLKPGFPVAIGSGWFTGLATSGETPSPALADLDGDGDLEIIAIDLGLDDFQNRASVVAIKGDGAILFSTFLPRSLPSGNAFDEYPQNSVPMIGNITGSSSPEIVVGVFARAASPQYTSFHVLSAQGGLLPGWPVRVVGGIQLSSAFGAGILADLDRNGFDEFVVTSPGAESLPPRLHVFNGAGEAVSGFPRDLYTTSSNSNPSYPALADVDHDGFLDIVTLSGGRLSGPPGPDTNFYLLAHNQFGGLVSQVVWPAIINSQFGQGMMRMRLALAESQTGQVCAVFTITQFPPNQSNLQLQARCFDGNSVPGYPVVLPSLSEEPFREDADSLSLVRDTGSAQVDSVLIDRSGNVRKRVVFSSTRVIPFAQFQHDAANTGRVPIPAFHLFWDGFE